MQNEFMSRTKFVIVEIIRELERPDRDEVRLKRLRADLHRLAIGKEQPMKKTIVLTYGEVIAVCVAFMLLSALCAQLYLQMSKSRSNEREMSQRYYQLIRNGGPR